MAIIGRGFFLLVGFFFLATNNNEGMDSSMFSHLLGWEVCLCDYFDISLCAESLTQDLCVYLDARSNKPFGAVDDHCAPDLVPLDQSGENDGNQCLHFFFEICDVFMFCIWTALEHNPVDHEMTNENKKRVFF